TELKQWQESLNASHADALMGMMIYRLNFEKQTLVGQQLARGVTSEDSNYFNQQLRQFGLHPKGLDPTIINMPNFVQPYEIEVTEKAEGKENKTKMKLPPFSNGLALTHHYGMTGTYALGERQLNQEEIKSGSKAIPVGSFVGLGGIPTSPFALYGQLGF